MSARPDDAQHYEALKRAVAELGPIRRGSVLRRFMPCGKAGCCCQADPPQLHGPYHEWTRKVRGKTVSVRLTQPKAKAIQEWIANARRLEQIIADMEAVSFRITERLLHSLEEPSPAPIKPPRGRR
jgi:hypothetical protein